MNIDLWKAIPHIVNKLDTDPTRSATDILYKTIYDEDISEATADNLRVIEIFYDKLHSLEGQLERQRSQHSTRKAQMNSNLDAWNAEQMRLDLAEHESFSHSKAYSMEDNQVCAIYRNKLQEHSSQLAIANQKLNLLQKLTTHPKFTSLEQLLH
jgi:hypothetical protein